ncbi:MAG: LD-carboxypeptidase [Alphaproteobacteria bacterium]|nr:LD-carboxypeptidase [Alphaproteobacteria bacterium]
MKIAIVAPANRLDPAVAERVKALAGNLYPNRVTLYVHPQCHLASGHFAGDDAARAAAFVEVANDPSFDAVWFARGGYGSCRIVESVLPKLTDVARRKTYLGYSDLGTLLAGLYGKAFPHVAHGPMPSDILRDGGEAAVRRALAFLVDRAPEAVEPTTRASKSIAFNLKTFASLLGTPLAPDITGHVLLLEDVSEYMYAIDRAFFQVTSNPGVRRAAGIRLGRCSQIPPNDPDFAKTEVDVAQHWCKVSGIPYLGRADIGHDADNKVVPFGDIAMS